MFDHYTLIVNQLREIHHHLTQKILRHKTRSPKWTIEEIEISQGKTERFVEELEALNNLIMTLDHLARHHDHQSDKGQHILNTIEPGAPTE